MYQSAKLANGDKLNEQAVPFGYTSSNSRDNEEQWMSSSSVFEAKPEALLTKSPIKSTVSPNVSTNKPPHPYALPKQNSSSCEREGVQIAASKCGTFLFAPEEQDDDHIIGLLKKKVSQPPVEDSALQSFSRHSEVSGCQLSYGDPCPQLSTLSSFHTDDQFADIGQGKDSGVSEAVKPATASGEPAHKRTGPVTGNRRSGIMPTRRKGPETKDTSKPGSNVRRTSAAAFSTPNKQNSPALLRGRSMPVTTKADGSQLPTELEKAADAHRSKKSIFESLYERRFTRRFVASLEEARNRRNSKSSSAAHSTLSASSKDSFTSLAPNDTRLQDQIVSPRTYVHPGRRISVDSRNSRSEEVSMRSSMRSTSVPYTRQPHPMPKEEMPTVAEAPLSEPNADVPIPLPTIAGQVPAVLVRQSDTELPRVGDFTLVSSDQTTPVPQSGMDFKRESAEERGQFTPGRSAELPRKISTDVYRVPAYASGMSSFGEMSPTMAMTLSGGSFEDHLPTRFSHMDSGLMTEAAEFCYDLMNEPREVFGSHPRLPRDVVERTDCRPQHTSIWGVSSQAVPPEKLFSSDSLPTVCQVVSSKESNRGIPAMANEIQTADQHDISTQNIQGQKSRLAPMAQVSRPTTLDTCSPLCRTSKSSRVVPNFTEFKNTGPGVEKTLGILCPAVTEGASVVVEGEHKSPCCARDSGEDHSSHMETMNKRSLQLTGERGACPEPVMMKPSPPTAKEYFMSAGGASLQFLSASIDPHTLSEVSETLAMSTVLPEGKETETKTAETVPVDAVVRDFFSIEPADPTLMAQASSASSSSTSSPATRSKQASAKPENVSVPHVGQLYKKRSYSSSAVDDNTDYGSRITDAILYKAFTPPFRFRIEAPSSQTDSQYEKLDTSQISSTYASKRQFMDIAAGAPARAQIIRSADEDAAQDEIMRKLGKLDAAVEKALQDIKEKKAGLYELSYSLFQTCILTNEKIPEIKRRYREYVLSVRSLLTNPEIKVSQELRGELKEQAKVVVEEYIRLLEEKVMRQFWAPVQDKGSMLRLKADFLRYLLELNPGEESYATRCQMTYKDTKLFFIEHKLQKTVEWVYLQMNYAAFLYMTGALNAALYISRQLTKSPLLSRCSKDVQKRLESNLKLYQML